MQISIIIPIYNKIEIIYDCIKFNISHCVHTHEWIVIDNGSDVQTKDGLSNLQSYATSLGHTFIIHTETYNTGVAKAWNKGLSMANAANVLILNNDCVLMPAWDVAITSTLTTYSHHIISPMVIEPEWYSGYTLEDFLNGKINYQKILKINNKRTITTYFGGVAIAGSKTLFDTVGEFDENFWLLLEDYDYLMRAKKAGINPIIDCSVAGYHYTSLTRKDMHQTFDKNYTYFHQKWGFDFQKVDNNFSNKLHRSLKKKLFKWFAWYHQKITLPAV
ncbi:MAG: glycosyltransferase [Cytophagales bacterium]|nr:glycosyltransferase [Cytophagales bacterium]